VTKVMVYMMASSLFQFDPRKWSNSFPRKD
jgi:hypothetical protein